MIQLHAATTADLVAYGGEPLPGWCAKWVGHVAKRDGEIVGLALLCWDKDGNLSAWVDEKEPIPAIVKHRLALNTLSVLGRLGEKMVSVFCDPRKPGAEMWLDRLGFVPCEVVDWGLGPVRVWRCDLSR
jgi:hypothetical protein